MDPTVIVAAVVGLVGTVIAAVVALRGQRGPLSYLAQLAPYFAAGDEGAKKLSQELIAELTERWHRRKSRLWLNLSWVGLVVGGVLGIVYATVPLEGWQAAVGVLAAVLYFGGSVSLAIASLVYYRHGSSRKN